MIFLKNDIRRLCAGIFNKSLFILFLSIVLCGCSITNRQYEMDVSDCDLFEGYFESDHVLLRDVGIIKEHLISYYILEDLNSKSFAKSIEVNRYTKSSDISVIKGGANVKIQRVRLEKIYNGPTVLVVYGKIYVNTLKDGADFMYYWDDIKKITRAPWEDEAVAEFRTLEGRQIKVHR
ncbi:MAG: hypothetical protein AB7D06_02510 [Pedobacter sp.]